MTGSDVTLIVGDCLDLMPTLPDNSVDAIVTDPPYGLGFMGKAWDDLPPGLPWATECLRVLKPGGHLVAFGGTRTSHRLVCAIEDAGFEIRDSIVWLYGSGFPKSQNVALMMDKNAGHVSARGSAINVSGKGDRDDIDTSVSAANGKLQPAYTDFVSPEAQQWQGWGTALKPAHEPIVVARKPFRGTVAANVLRYGTGAINIDGCRIGTTVETWPKSRRYGGGRGDSPEASAVAFGRDSHGARTEATGAVPAGRWPANVILDESQAAALDEMSGTKQGSGKVKQSGARAPRGMPVYDGGDFTTTRHSPDDYGDSGGASRFFYCAKAPKRERPVVDGISHPTVKPVTLMRYLIRMHTPPGGTILDPFAGSGATVEAAVVEGFGVIAIERGGPDGTPEATYPRMIRQRLANLQAPLFGN